MSYVVTIRRESGLPITREEVLECVDQAQDLEADHEAVLSEAGLPFWWSPGTPEDRVALVHVAGTIQTLTTPSSATLRRLQSLAQELGGRLSGEEGEDLTSVHIPDIPPPGPSSCGCVVVALLGAAILAWLAF